MPVKKQDNFPPVVFDSGKITIILIINNKKKKKRVPVMQQLSTYFDKPRDLLPPIQPRLTTRVLFGQITLFHVMIRKNFFFCIDR